jgi:hypothetical protein
MAQAMWRRFARAVRSGDEGELESAIGDLPDHAELHLHVPPKPDHSAPPNGGDQTPPAPPSMPSPTIGSMDEEEKKPFEELKNSDRAHDLENEELWEAIEGLERAVVMGMGDSVKLRDRWPHRDARRTRMGLRDRRSRDEDKDDEEDDEKDTKDAFRDPPEAGGGGNRKILSGFQMEAPPGTADRYRGARDSAWMADTFQDTLTLAEVLVPGIQMPTFDGAAPPKRTHNTLCAFRARVIDFAWQQPGSRELIERMTRGHFHGTRDMACADVKALFEHLGVAKQIENDGAKGHRPAASSPGDMLHPVGAHSLAEVQELNRRAWAKQPPTA